MSVDSRLAARKVKAELQRLIKIAKPQELTLLRHLLENALVEAEIQCHAVIDLKPVNGRY